MCEVRLTRSLIFIASLDDPHFAACFSDVLLPLQIDVLIFFDQASLVELGGISPVQMMSILAAEIQESNLVVANSEIDLEFALVHIAEVRVLPVVYRSAEYRFQGRMAMNMCRRRLSREI